MKQEIFDFNGRNYLIRIGQNKEENFVILDESNENDIWFHVDKQPSSHVILTNHDNEKINSIPRQVIKRCAYLCKINSKAKKMKICDIMYSYVRNVIKTDIIGLVNVTEYKLIDV